MKQLFLLVIIATALCSCSPATFEPIPTATLTATQKPTITPTMELPTPTATAVPTKTTTLSQCPKIGGGGNSWERYKPNSFENVLTEVSQISSSQKDPLVDSYYLEVSNDYQFPSCVMLEYSGTYREIPDEQNFLVKAWSGLLGPDRGAQMMAILQHDVLLTDNGQEYWLPIQEQLIPFMEDELTINEPVIVFIIWIGTSFSGDKTEQIFIIGEFSKP